MALAPRKGLLARLFAQQIDRSRPNDLDVQSSPCLLSEVHVALSAYFFKVIFYQRLELSNRVDMACVGTFLLLRAHESNLSVAPQDQRYVPSVVRCHPVRL